MYLPVLATNPCLCPDPFLESELWLSLDVRPERFGALKRAVCSRVIRRRRERERASGRLRQKTLGRYRGVKRFASCCCDGILVVRIIVSVCGMTCDKVLWVAEANDAHYLARPSALPFVCFVCLLRSESSLRLRVRWRQGRAQTAFGEVGLAQLRAKGPTARAFPAAVSTNRGEEGSILQHQPRSGSHGEGGGGGGLIISHAIIVTDRRVRYSRVLDQLLG